jgi:hypothetical protein
MNTSPLLMLLLAQLIYSTKDLLARSMVRGHNFGAQLLHKPQFYLILIMHFTGLVIQLYVLSNFYLSRTMTGFAMVSIILSSILGWLVLGEQISGAMYIAIALAFSSLLILAFAVK